MAEATVDLDSIQSELKQLRADANKRLKPTKSLETLSKLRVEVFGKKGSLAALQKLLGKATPADRPKLGQAINEVRQELTESFAEVQTRLEAEHEAAELAGSRFDVTLPGRRPRLGMEHPLRIVEREIVSCLRRLGFSVAEGPLVEHDWFNFEALNIPADHPARDMQDTFFLSDEVVLRTHTSNVQIRTMVKEQPPLRIIAPGMVFRKDDVDATHSPVFHQIEGLWLDSDTTFADLKGVLRLLALTLFGDDTKVRFRPSFFPFTEPSLEMDVQSPAFGDRWLEILGAGMVDPAVLEAVNYDPETVQGFAFGIGLERVAMLRWGIEDIRLFYENDRRFLQQFVGA